MNTVIETKSRYELINEIRKVMYLSGIPPQTIEGVNERPDEEIKQLHAYLCRVDPTSNGAQQSGSKKYGRQVQFNK